jgi:hypothetical protein
MESSMLTSVIDSNLYASVLASGTTRAYVYLYVISQGSLFKRRPRSVSLYKSTLGHSEHLPI